MAELTTPIAIRARDVLCGSSFAIAQADGSVRRFRAITPASNGWYCVALFVKPQKTPRTQRPFVVTTDAIREAEKQGRFYALGPGEDPKRPRFEETLSAPQVAGLAFRWTVVTRVLHDHTKYLTGGITRALLLRVLETEGFAPNTVRVLMSLYYVGGCYREALIPAHDGQGAPGAPREKRIVQSISGSIATPPEELIVTDGRPMTQPDIDIMDAFLEEWVLTPGLKRLSSTNAHTDLLRQCFSVTLGDPAKDIGAAQFTIVGPSVHQVRRRIRTLTDSREALVARAGDLVMNQQMREVMQHLSQQIAGPGEQYELDCWQIQEIKLVYEVDRSITLGSPFVYAFMDRATGSCAGIAASYARPSYESALTAMLAAVSRKSAYCARFGVMIDDALWPHFGWPTLFVCDRGEMQQLKFDAWPAKLGVEIVNLGPRRPELKPFVEGWFGQTLPNLIQRLPGALTAEQRERGLKAGAPVLTLRRFTALLIHAALRYNATLVPESSVAPWVREAGICARRRSALFVESEQVFAKVRRDVDLEQVLLAHATPVQVTTSEDGIALNDAFYDCQWAREQGFFLRGTGRLPKLLMAVDDRSRMGSARLIDPRGGKTYPMTLASGYEHLADVSVSEYDAYQKQLNPLRKREKAAALVAAVATSAATQAIVEEETKATRQARRAAAKTSAISFAPPPLKLLPRVAPSTRPNSNNLQQQLLDALQKNSAANSAPTANE